MIERVVEQFGGIDILVLSVGLEMHFKFEEIQDLSLIERITEANYYAPVYCTHYALSHLMASNGQIIVVSSVAGMSDLQLVLLPIHSRPSYEMEIKHVVDSIALFLNLISITLQTFQFEYFKKIIVVRVNNQLVKSLVYRLNTENR
jgi:short-subunit dehydrogenase involved in D-alanine esterification of teichoic acids